MAKKFKHTHTLRSFKDLEPVRDALQKNVEQDRAWKAHRKAA